MFRVGVKRVRWAAIDGLGWSPELGGWRWGGGWQEILPGRLGLGSQFHERVILGLGIRFSLGEGIF